MKKNKLQQKMMHQYILTYLDQKNEIISIIDENLNLIFGNKMRTVTINFGAGCTKKLYEFLVFTIFENKKCLFHSFIFITDPYNRTQNDYFIEQIIKDYNNFKIKNQNKKIKN